MTASGSAPGERYRATLLTGPGPKRAASVARSIATTPASVL